jgi:hypothetical protein
MARIAGIPAAVSVLVVATGCLGEGDRYACAYICRDDGRAAEVRRDDGCRHWKYD